MDPNTNITVIGLGKLGSCLAAVLAGKKYHVTGIDINPLVLQMISRRKSPYKEPGLENLLIKTKNHLHISDDTKKACSESDIIFIILPTPSEKDGSFSLKYISSALKPVGAGLKESTKKFPLVVITSTVMPGDCEKFIIPQLQKISSKKCGKDFGLCYNPEFIALGSVIHDIQNPDMVLIGEFDTRSGEKLTRVYKKILAKKAHVERMNLINSEIVKLSINTFVTTKISYANMLTQICNETHGANVDTVTNALGKDSRIGSKYLRGGVPFGGPCFPRDNRAFQKIAGRKKLTSFIAEATDKTNNSQVDFIYQQIKKIPSKIKRVGILGLSYKPCTSVIEESASIKLATALLKGKYTVSGFDPLVEKRDVNGIKLAKTRKELIESSDLVVIMNNEPSYSNLKPSDINDKIYVMDCWRILDTKKWKDHKNLISLGIGK